jgi:hypothetical protein
LAVPPIASTMSNRAAGSVCHDLAVHGSEVCRHAYLNQPDRQLRAFACGINQPYKNGKGR